MGNNNATCSICGKPYRKCMSCQDSKIKPWHSIVDTYEHYKIFITIRDYNNGYIDKSEAKSQLAKLDLTGLDDFVVEIKDKINEILVEEVKINNSKSKKKNVNSIVIPDFTI